MRFSNLILIAIPVLTLQMLCTQVYAEIVDEGRVFEELRTHNPKARFADVLKCGQEQVMKADNKSCTYSCSEGGCISQCSEADQRRFVWAVESCDANSASIYGDDATDLKVTRAEFEQGGNTYVIPILNKIDRYIQPGGQVVLTNLWPTRRKFIADGRLQEIDGWEIAGEVRYGSSQSPNFSVLIFPQFHDLRQIGGLFTDPTESFFKIRGLIDVAY